MYKRQIYTSNTSYTSIRKYQQHVRDEVLVRSEALGTGIGFFAADGSLYMMRNLLDANYRTYGVLVMELNKMCIRDRRPGSTMRPMWRRSRLTARWSTRCEAP